MSCIFFTVVKILIVRITLISFLVLKYRRINGEFIYYLTRLFIGTAN